MYQTNPIETLRRQLEISREQAILLGEEAVRIIRNGYYQAKDGTRIEIYEEIEKSVPGTVSYPPEKYFPTKSPGEYGTKIEIQNCTTLTAVQNLLGRGSNPVALNFASVVEPGGWFFARCACTGRVSGTLLDAFCVSTEQSHVCLP